MEITFASKEIRKICNSAAEAESALGIGIANSLRRILADLRATRFLSEFALLYSLEVTSETVQLTIGKGASLTLSIAHRLIPQHEGKVDAGRVHRVMVVALRGEGQSE